jgi:uncharacterized membrane protein
MATRPVNRTLDCCGNSHGFSLLFLAGDKVMTQKNLKYINTFLLMLNSFAILLFCLPFLVFALLILLSLAGSPDAQERYLTKGWVHSANGFGLNIFLFASIAETALNWHSYRMDEEEIKHWEPVRARGKQQYINWCVIKSLKVFLYTSPIILIGALALYYLSGKTYGLGLLVSALITIIIFAIFVFIFNAMVYAEKQWALNEKEYNLSSGSQSNTALDRRPRS